MDGLSCFSIEVSGSEAKLSVRGVDPEYLGHQGELFFFGAVSNRLSTLTGGAVTASLGWARTLGVQSEIVSQRLGMRRIDRTASTTAVIVDKASLSLRLPSSDPTLHAILKDHSSKLLSVTTAVPPFRSLVREVLKLDLLRGEEVSRAMTAKRLGTSVRTFQRRLLAERTTFQEELESVRQDAAVELSARGARRHAHAPKIATEN